MSGARWRDSRGARHISSRSGRGDILAIPNNRRTNIHGVTPRRKVATAIDTPRKIVQQGGNILAIIRKDKTYYLCLGIPVTQLWEDTDFEILISIRLWVYENKSVVLFMTRINHEQEILQDDNSRLRVLLEGYRIYKWESGNRTILKDWRGERDIVYKNNDRNTNNSIQIDTGGTFLRGGLANFERIIDHTSNVPGRIDYDNKRYYDFWDFRGLYKGKLDYWFNKGYNAGNIREGYNKSFLKVGTYISNQNYSQEEYSYDISGYDNVLNYDGLLSSELRGGELLEHGLQRFFDRVGQGAIYFTELKEYLHLNGQALFTESTFGNPYIEDGKIIGADYSLHNRLNLVYSNPFRMAHHPYIKNGLLTYDIIGIGEKYVPIRQYQWINNGWRETEILLKGTYPVNIERPFTVILARYYDK